MRDVFSMYDVVLPVLKGSALDLAITGSIEPEKRKADSALEYVVINSIVLLPGSVSLGKGNVNIHVPDRSDGKPNLARLKELTRIAIPLLQEVSGRDYIFGYEGHEIIEEEGHKCHYSNIKLKFRFMG